MNVSFADKLNALMSALACDASGTPMSASKFVDDFNSVSSVTISKGYLSELRNGAVTNPRIALVEAIAKYFGVSSSYFFDNKEDELNVERILLMGAMRSHSVTNLGARTQGLPPEGLRRIRLVIESERRKAGLTDSSEEPMSDRP